MNLLARELAKKLADREAAIKRVRELCDQRDAEVADMDAFYRQVVLVSVDEVRRALDGAE